MSKGPFKMKGHFLPGINQRSEGQTDMPDGRSASSAFQQSASPIKAKGWLGKKLGFKKAVGKYIDKKLMKKTGEQTVTKSSTEIVKKSTDVIKGGTKSKSNLWSKLRGTSGKRGDKPVEFVKSTWVTRNPKKAGIGIGLGVVGVDLAVKGIKEKIRSKRKAKQEMKKPTPPPKSTGRKTYKQAYTAPKVTAKYKDKGGYAQFVKEAEAWWKTSAGQKYAKKNPQFKHRIIK